jgi:predicted nucleotidyltransferase
MEADQRSCLAEASSLRLALGRAEPGGLAAIRYTVKVTYIFPQQPEIVPATQSDMIGRSMRQDKLIEAISAALANHRSVRGLFLAGSYGKGTSDAFSDIDFLAVVDDTERAGFVTEWRAVLEGIAPVVFWSQRPGNGILVNAITADWVRCDLIVSAEAGSRAVQRRH